MAAPARSAAWVPLFGAARTMELSTCQHDVLMSAGRSHLRQIIASAIICRPLAKLALEQGYPSAFGSGRRGYAPHSTTVPGGTFAAGAANRWRLPPPSSLSPAGAGGKLGSSGKTRQAFACCFALLRALVACGNLEDARSVLPWFATARQRASWR